MPPMWKWVLVLAFILTWSASPADAATTGNSLQQLQENLNQAVATVRPSVVSIKALKKKHAEGGQAGEFIWYESIGSGFIVDDRGFIVTNYHVVKDAEKLVVSLWRSRGKDFMAEVVDLDESQDLALLKIESQEPFIPAELGNSDRLEPGDWVISVGSPFGFEHTATIGIVGDLNRNLTIEGISYRNMIQTDATINLGNSGGPLINVLGEVVGVGTAIYSPGGAHTGLGFAIPINRVKHFYSRTTGAVQAALPNTAGRQPVGEAINIGANMPGDAVHREFSDCTSCHSISQKSVVSVRAAMLHPPVGACGNCHVLVNERVAAGPTTVAATQPLDTGSRGFLSKEIYFKTALLILVGAILFTMLGVGGGFLYVPILLSSGIDFHVAATTSLIMLATAQISALYNFFRSGLVDLRLAMVLGLPTMIAAFAGGMLARYFNVSVLYLMFALVLFLSSYLMFQDEDRLGRLGKRVVTSPWKWRSEFAGYTYNVDLAVAIPLALMVGFLSGMLGLGGGWLIVPMMVVLFNVPMKIAVATSSLMVPVTGLSGFFGHSAAGHFEPRLAISLSLVAIVGAQIGSKISIKTESVILKTTFAFVLGLIGIWMILRVI